MHASDARANRAMSRLSSSGLLLHAVLHSESPQPNQDDEERASYDLHHCVVRVELQSELKVIIVFCFA